MHRSTWTIGTRALTNDESAQSCFMQTLEKGREGRVFTSSPFEIAAL
jgi:hypothetical protein